MHVIISYGAISNPKFIKYFIPQTWFAGRIFLSSLLVMAIIKYSKISKGKDERYQSKEEGKTTKFRKKDTKKNLVYLMLLGVFSFGVSINFVISYISCKCDRRIFFA